MNRRAARRSTWLGRDLRARRRELLRSFWWPLTAIAAAFTAGSTPLVVVLRHHPWLQGATVGVLLGAGAVGLRFLLALVDGTLLARIGRWHETNVGDDLRQTPGVYGVLSNVPFDRVDVDHVVLTPTGCYAVEVKSLLGHQEPLDTTWGLPAKIGQADEGARRIRLFFRSKKLDIPVTPLLVLAGPGAPDLPDTGVVHDSGVRVVAHRNSSTWLRRVAAPTTDPGPRPGHRPRSRAGAARVHRRPAPARRGPIHPPPRPSEDAEHPVVTTLAGTVRDTPQVAVRFAMTSRHRVVRCSARVSSW